MKAAVLVELQKPLVVQSMLDPECAPHGAIVRVEANGVCRSDWHAWMGDWSWFGLRLKLPHVLGHELCGVVEETGKDVKTFKKGDRVVIPFSQGEGTCEYCRSGHSNICRTPINPGMSYWGGFGRFVAVPFADNNLVALAESIDFVEAASMGCRFMTSFHGIVDQAQVRAGEWVAVHGCGGIGLSAIHICAALGANPIGIDLDDAKLELAKKVGASHVVNGKQTDAVKAVKELTKGGADVAIDALGIAATCRNSIMSLRKRGRHLQIGMTTQAEKGEIAFPVDRIVQMELQIVGSLGMQAARYPSMLRMVEAGKLSPKSMVTRTVPLEQASSVIESMTSYQTVGVTVVDRY